MKTTHYRSHGKFAKATHIRKHYVKITFTLVTILSTIGYINSQIPQTLANDINLDTCTPGYLSPVPCNISIDTIDNNNWYSLSLSDIESYYKQQETTEDKQEQESVTDKITSVFKDHAPDAILIAQCESGLNPNAINNSNSNGSTDTGLFQINSIHNIPQRYLLNPDINIQVAYQLFQQQGWSPWVCKHVLNNKIDKEVK